MPQFFIDLEGKQLLFSFSSIIFAAVLKAINEYPIRYESAQDRLHCDAALCVLACNYAVIAYEKGGE